MKPWAFWFVLAAVGTTLTLLALGGVDSFGSLPVSILRVQGESMNSPTYNRKLKARSHAAGPTDVRRDLVSINLAADYPSFDPVPSSKAAIKGGPIEHGTPLMPYVPKPEAPPPSHPGHGGSP